MRYSHLFSAPSPFPLQACLAENIPANRLVVANQNAADFVRGLRTGAGDAASLGRARTHCANVVDACANIGKAGGIVAAACVPLGWQPSRSGKEARHLLASGALQVGSRLVIIPSMGRLEAQPPAHQQALNTMVNGILQYGGNLGYGLEEMPEEGQHISRHARVFRVVAHNPQPAPAALVQPDVPNLPTAAGVVAALHKHFVLPEDSLYVWVKRTDDARLKMHLLPGCSGANLRSLRDDVESGEVCSHCLSAYRRALSLRDMLDLPPAVPIEPPSPPPRDVEAQQEPAADDDIADGAEAAAAAPNMVLLAVGRGQKVHWSECQAVVSGRTRGAHVVRRMTFDTLWRERVRFKGACVLCTNTGHFPEQLLEVFPPQQ